MEPARPKVIELLRRNISGAEIARRLGISRQRVSQIAKSVGIRKAWVMRSTDSSKNARRC